MAAELRVAAVSFESSLTAVAATTLKNNNQELLQGREPNEGNAYLSALCRSFTLRPASSTLTNALSLSALTTSSARANDVAYRGRGQKTKW